MIEEIRKLEERKQKLLEAVRATKGKKQGVIKIVQDLVSQFNLGRISRQEYDEKVGQSLDKRSAEQWIKYYDDFLAYYEYQIKLCNRLIKGEKRDLRRETLKGKGSLILKIFIAVVLLVLVVSLFFVFKPKLQELAEGGELVTQVPVFLDAEVQLIEESLVQYSAVLGKPVKWKKEFVIDSISGFTLELPEDSKNVVVKQIKDGKEQDISSIIKVDEKGIFRKRVEVGINKKTITGNAILDIGEGEIGYEIEYETPSPEIFEEDISRGKRITIRGPDDVHYENILSFTKLAQGFADVGSIKLYEIRNNQRIATEFSVYDTDEDGIIDFIEWITPYLSEAVFEIVIEISKAEHLDENHIFISDIYSAVYKLDDVWSEEILDEHYVRVTFEQALDNTKDITLYPRVVSGNPRIEVYEFEGSEIIAEFESLVEGKNTIYLTELIGSQDVFDLKVVDGSVEIDYVVDPLTFEEISICSNLGMVSYWTLDDVDLSGAGHPLDVFGTNEGTNYGATSGQVGQVSEAFLFNRVEEDYVDIANEANFDFERTDAFSACAWIKPEGSMLGQYTILSKLDSSARGWEFHTYDYSNADGLSLYLINDWSGDNKIDVSVTNSLTAGNWHHVCFTYDGSSSALGIKIYLEGVSQSFVIGTDSLSSSILNNEDVSIGARENLGGVSQEFQGLIDEVAVFDRELAHTEIYGFYQKGVRGVGYCEAIPISTCEELQGIGTTTGTLDDDYILIQNIDCSMTDGWNHDGGTGLFFGFDPIGTSSNRFRGIFDGQGYIINNLFINRLTESYIGLFAGIDDIASIQNVGLENVYIRGRNDVGGLVGWNMGLITASYTTGTVIGVYSETYVGGLVGNNEGVVENSYSKANVTGKNYVGGLIGDNDITVKNSYAIGNVVGTDTYVGGLVGDSWLGTCIDSFWNTDIFLTDGCSSGSTGKTTVEMKEVDTFTLVPPLTTAWDFVNNPNDDVENLDIWDIGGLINNGYPFLRGFAEILDTTPPDINFTWPTPENDSTLFSNEIFVNVSASDVGKGDNNISTFIDFDNSLVGWWRMDDVNSSGDVVDYIRVNNGTAGGNAVQTKGYLGKGFEFDGDGDYIAVDSTEELEPENELTISSWIKTDSVDYHGGMIATGGDHYGMYVTTSGGIHFFKAYALESWISVNTIGINVLDNDWHHVACTNGPNGLIIYVDGINYGSNSSLTQPIVYWMDTDFEIGRYGNQTEYGPNNDYDFNGTIDDVIIFNRSLSAEEVYGLYANKSSDYLFQNFADLIFGNHIFKAYAQDTAGNVNNTEGRIVMIEESDVTPPDINFTWPTPANKFIFDFLNNIFVNVSANDSENNISTFIDFDNSLVGWWRMDDVNSSGDVVDYLGVNNGTWSSNTTRSEGSDVGPNGQIFAGKLGKGWQFDGEGDKIKIPHNSNQAISNSGTWAFWVKLDTYYKQTFISKRDNWNINNAWAIGIDYGSPPPCKDDITFEFAPDGTGITKTEFGWNRTNIPLGEWAFVTFVYNSDDTDRNVRMYVNSTEIEPFHIDNQNTSIFAGTSDIYIGAVNNGTGWTFNGSIDDVMIFNRALDVDEISALYANTSTTYLEHDFTSLINGDYLFKAYAQDTAGNVNETEEREVTINFVDNFPPDINFTNPTPTNGSTQSNTNIYVNVSANDTSSRNISTFIDFDNSLVGWWRMDDVNSSGDVVDYLGVNNGTAAGNAVQTNDGYLGKGFSFDGTSDYINFGDILDSTLTTEFSFSSWVYLTSNALAPTRTILAKSEGLSSGGGIAIAQGGTTVGANKIVVNLFDGASPSPTFVTTATITTSAWTHLVVNWNGSTTTDSVKVYFNGIKQAGSETNYGTPPIVNALGLKLGIRDGTVNSLLGSIDDVLIFNRSLSADEIRGLYANTSQRYLKKNFTSLSEGSHAFKAYTQDLAGNVNETEERSVEIITPQPPEIVYISEINGYENSGDVPSGDRDLIPGGTASKDFKFYVYSPEGLVALPSGADVTDANVVVSLVNVDSIKKGKGIHRKSRVVDGGLGCTRGADAIPPAGSPYDTELAAVYTCTVNMQYYDDYGSDTNQNWEIRPYIKDIFAKDVGYEPIGEFYIDDNLIFRTTFFNRLDSSALIPAGGAMEFGTVFYGLQTTQPVDVVDTYPLRIRNIGNTNITPIRVQGEDIPGLDDNTKYVLASWFSVSEAGSNPCVGTLLVDGSLIDSGISQIDYGFDEFKDLRVCLTDVQATASIQAYSTTEPVKGVSWVIDTTFVFILAISKFFRINFGISLLVVSVIIRNKKKKSKKRKKKYNLSEEDLLVLNNKLKEKYNVGIEELLEISEKKEYEDELEVQIPINIFNQQISPAEVLCKYLKENLGLNFRTIAKLINRDERTVWINYRNSVKKKKEKIKIEKKPVEKEIGISIKIFSDRRLSILESVVNYLKKKEFRNSEISEMLGKDQRNIHTLYSRVQGKLNLRGKSQ